MNARNWLVLGLVAGIAACGGDSSEPISSGDAGEPDAGGPDARAGGDAASCPAGGNGMLALEVQIEEGVLADVLVTGAGEPRPVTAGETLTLPAGPYEIAARRVMQAGTMVGAAYQPTVQTEQVCVRADGPATARVVYTREPGSARLWLTQTNGTGPQVMGFDASQLMAAGDVAPAAGFGTGQPNAGAIRVDARGRLWVGSTSGAVSGFDTARLGTASSEPPDVILKGSAICGPVIPCGPRAIAFDRTGAMWLAVHAKIIKLAPESLDSSGSPAAVVAITSPELGAPNGLAFDASGNLWVASSEGTVLQFAAARLTADIVDGASDISIETQEDGPVKLNLGGPEGLVFDADGNLWIGYFLANKLVRLTPAELASDPPAGTPIIASTVVTLGALSVLTDLGIDEAGNLWFPSRSGEFARIDRAQLSAATPTVHSFRSAGISSVGKLALHAVSGDLFIAP